MYVTTVSKLFHSTHWTPSMTYNQQPKGQILPTPACVDVHVKQTGITVPMMVMHIWFHLTSNIAPMSHPTIHLSTQDVSLAVFNSASNSLWSLHWRQSRPSIEVTRWPMMPWCYHTHLYIIMISKMGCKIDVKGKL